MSSPLDKIIHEKSALKGRFILTGNALSSQPVSRQVLSTYECLTSVFGMGTGGSTQLSSPDFIGFVLPKLYKSEPTSQSLQVKLSAY